MQDQKRKPILSDGSELPIIPDKLYFTIGEVGKLCDIKPHVLRYWEQEFGQLSPCKRRGNRRYYQRKDVLLVRQLKELLYTKGFTIEGARAQLNLQPENKDTNKIETQVSLEAIQSAVKELESLLMDLKG